ncbi:MAG: DUF2071 domain-containing protein [Deltaproteobacteria bacterium]|nr:DUF2071 domain-containing protein [Deltaproteobacteria bacterium]
MVTVAASPHPPTEAQRLAARARPAGNPVMYQRWRELLFLHWEYPVATIQRTLPEGLFVDTFHGKAYLAIVPFFMRDIRPRFLPAVPGLSSFPELNLRTYVYDGAGVPGVWFYSLDADQRLAVAIARRFFDLPYVYARMRASRTTDGATRYRSVRPGDDASCVYEYAPREALPQPAPGSLEFFLVERYRVYAASTGRLRRGAVFHPPYPLWRAEVTAASERLMALDGFAPTGRPPDHVVMSHGVDVEVFPLRPA